MSAVARLVCWLKGGHVWDDWRDLTIEGWATNGDPRLRLCLRCWKPEWNRDGRILSALALGDR